MPVQPQFGPVQSHCCQVKDEVYGLPTVRVQGPYVLDDGQ